MDMVKSIQVMSLATVLLVGCCGSPWPKKASVPDDMMTKWGPKLSEQELAAIAKLSTTELVDMLRTGDTLHASAALKQLKANGGWKKNFDLLLSMAARTQSGYWVVIPENFSSSLLYKKSLLGRP